MSHHLVQKIASVVLVLGIFVSIFMAAQTARAQTISTPFGGTVIQFVPPIPYVCPYPHILLFDFGKKAAIGLVPLPGSQIYAYWNLFTNGTFLLGTSSTTPITCLLPYPIFPIIMVGTS